MRIERRGAFFFALYPLPFTLLLLAFCLTLLTCGYHLQGRGGALPPTIKTMAVLPFDRQIPVLELDQRVTEAVTRELVQRARIKVQSSTAGADAVLVGTLTAYAASPVSYDPATGLANRYRVQMVAKVTVTDSAGKVLFKSDGFMFEELYERSALPSAYISDQVIAYDVIARDFARSLVSAIMEGGT